MKRLAALLAGVVTLLSLVAPVAAAQTVPDQFDLHRGRVYLFSPRPAWPLKPKADASPAFEYSDKSDNMYTDQAGVPWRLMSPCESAYHQTSGTFVSLVACKTGYLADNKKFVALDDSGGSFEAILQPDSPHGTATYDKGNWLTTGAKVGTYNYADPQPGCLQCQLAHYLLDMRPHDDRGYAPAPDEVWLDPTDPLLDWKTYRKRYLEQVQPIVEGKVKIGRGDDGRAYRLSTDGTTLTDPIDADLTAVALRAAAAMGQHPPLLKAPGAAKPTVHTGSSPASGTWHGRYHCSQGETGLDLTIAGDDPKALTASFRFYALTTNPTVPTGRYLMTGALTTPTLTLHHTRWVDAPPGYVMVDLNAVITGTHLTGTVTGPGCTDITLDRT
ncbi:hypothetical protein [Actinokineospora inagensis]|uniref:hypothetical protein n=1 Tax=Actinokineospora inagensis TaxID=103730 RepID=UPI00040A66A1|nr:hypothetical protein [Actinokineospora inagensis]